MFDKIKENLEDEISKICDYISDCKNKQQALKANTNDSKLTKIGVIGMLSIIPSMLASMGIVFPVFAGLALPPTGAMGVALASSIAIGCVGQSIIASISKRKMKKFTDAKTNADILEEMMRYEMEIDKSENKKDALRRMHKAFESKQQILGDYSSEFYQIDKYANLTSEDLKKRRDMLFKAYEERMEQLDILTSQAYLKNKFRNRRKKRERVEIIIKSSWMMSLPFCILIGVPLAVELMINVTMENFADFCKEIAMAFSPALVVTPLVLPYFIKREKDFKNVFHNLNQSLGENALSFEPNFEYENELEKMISSKKCEIAELGIEVEEIGYIIEKRCSENPTENNEREKGKSRDDLMPNKMEIMSSFASNIDESDVGYGNQTGDLQQDQRGSRFVKKRIPPQ